MTSPVLWESSPDSLKDWFIKNQGPKYAAHQVLRWIFAKHNLNPAQYSDVPEKFRNLLAEAFSFDLPQVTSIFTSTDGSEKLLLTLTDGQQIECVIMPSAERITLCISSQIGCKMHCSFCHTGEMGFIRQLSTAEIIGQVLVSYQRLKTLGIEQKITNLVFMGMGEPLDNYQNVVAACKIFLHEDYFAISKHKLTISTCGLVPQINQLAKELPLRLAISLHAADDKKREMLMPISKTYKLAELKQALLDYPAGRDGITFEYILISGINDSIADAKKLVKFVHGLKAKINLIPVNSSPNSNFTPPNSDEIRAFQEYLSIRSIPAPVRYSRGQDVLGACGQLATQNKALKET